MQAFKIHNENFHVAPGTESIRVLQNPKFRHKTLSCMAPSDKDAKGLEEVNKVRSRLYASDHRDTMH